MKNKHSEYYQIITGKIAELEVIDTDLSLFGKGSFASLPILGQLALGNTTEAASQVGMATDQEEAVNYLNSVQLSRRLDLISYYMLPVAIFMNTIFHIDIT